jgi:hypothetical protein
MYNNSHWYYNVKHNIEANVKLGQKNKYLGVGPDPMRIKGPKTCPSYIMS